MRKPVSKNSLRRAFDKAVAEGQVECSVPTNTVVDRIWHEMQRENYDGGRRKSSTSRESVRTAGIAEPADSELT